MDEDTSSYEVRPTMLLSSLVQTRSIELVLAPIASQVSQLIILTETRGTPFPNLMPTALSVMDAVQNLANVAKKITTETPDEKLQADLPVAYSQAVSAGQQLVEASKSLVEDPMSTDAQVLLHTAARGILEGTMKVLLVWDEGEVRKIVRAAHWTLDRLGLVKVAKSMRSLVICFGGLSEAMMLLLSLADKRQKELTDQERKKQVHLALAKLKSALPPFSEAMKKYVINPNDVPSQNLRNTRAGEISSAIHELISAVRPFDEVDFTESEPDNMATNIMEVQRQLAPDSRYFIGADLDKHLDAILQNSMAVAHVSRDRYREAILRLCSEVLCLRQELGENLTAVTNNPESVEARSAFDQTAEQLCEKLCEIDRWVADAVVDQVTEAFVEPSAPVHHLVQAAAGSHSTSTTSTPETSPPSSPYTSRESDALTKQVELFRRHSKRLSQVAAHAAQSSADSKRVQLITDLANQVDQLMPQVVEAAVAVRKSPADMDAKLHLDSRRKDWAGKVQQLTAAIDDIIDPEDFMAVSEANIHQDMTKCRDAIRNKNWSVLKALVQGIAAKAKRVAEIGKMAADQAKEPRKKERITAAVKRLEKAIPQVVTLGNELISNPGHQQSHDQFAESLKELLDSIHQTQAALKTDSTDVAARPPSPVVATSTPISAHLERRHQKPPMVSPVPPSPPPPPTAEQMRYIGSLKAGAAGRKRHAPPKTPYQPVDEPDAGDLTRASPTLHTSHGRSHSKASSTGDAQTQTPSVESRDRGLQADVRYPSDTFGSSSTAMNLSPTPSIPWVPETTPTAAAIKEKRREPEKDHSDSATQRTVQAYARPLQKLVSVAKEGEVDRLKLRATDLQARAIRLTGIAESAAGAVRHNPKLMKVLQVKASEVNKLTPQVIEHAEGLVKDPKESQRLEELQISSHQWAGHVRQLIEATQKANYPWSKTAQRLVTAAKQGEGLETQMKHVSTQTNRMVDVAVTTVKAAEMEEAMGSGDDSEVSHDPELQEQIRHVRVTTSEIQKLTPQLLSAAEMAAKQGEGSATMEHLNLLSQEWATKAKVLMRGVDDVSLGMGGPADTLLLSARSGDPTLLTEQSKAITELASSLQDVAQDALHGCEDEKKVQLVRVASDRINRVSTELIDCANKVAQVGGGDEETTQQQLEALQDTLENTELLRRDWASQVHLITTHIDELIAKVSAPLDRLVDVALQASRTTSMAKQHLLGKFEANASFISDQLEVIESRFQEATDAVEEREAALDNVSMAITFLKKLTPHAVGACRSLSSDPGSAMLDHFSHLRRQWASKAKKLLVSLKEVTSADMEEVLAAFEELIHHSKTGRATPRQSGSLTPAQKSYSFEDISEEEETGHLVVKEPSHSKLDPHKRYSATDDSLSSHHVVQASKRPTSMAVPLPSWVTDRDESVLTASSQSIAAAAQSLQEAANEFQEEENVIITVAKKMSQQMFQMAEFSRGRGELQSKTEMINTAKAIAANGQVIVQFANAISEQCTDRRMKTDLQYCAEIIPTLSTQLRIIASVKASTPDDQSADVMLVKNAQNLMQAVIRTMKAAEAACMKGLRAPEGSEQRKASNVAVNWKRKLYYHRTLESIVAPLGSRGLRKLNRSHISTPSIVDTLQSAMTL